MLLLAAPAQNAQPVFTIAVVDEDSGRGVPLIELRTVNNLRYYTDSNGLVAFREPGMFDRDVYFSVRGHGYEYPKDGFGFRGKTLHPAAGGRAQLKIKRLNIAERLYRVTGAGIYADSVLSGEKAPIKEPLLNAQVLGSDSVLNAVYRGKLHWFWGDTNKLSYALGNFDTPGAVSTLPADGGLDPENGVDLTYYADAKGFARPTLKMPGSRPTWMTTLIPLNDKGGKERLYASYVKVNPPLTIYGRGLAVWNDQKEEFERIRDVDMQAPIFPQGHAFLHEGHVYFADPYPLLRVRATAADFQNLDAYESFTCLREGSRLDAPRIELDANGLAHYAWRKNAPAVGPAEQGKLIAAGHIKPEESLLRLRDRDTGKPVKAHRGSLSWNDYRRKWALIAVQAGGTSNLGEVWYAEADVPTGPWGHALKVVTHDRYSFYNPKQHPVFAKEKGRIIFFEGTYSNSFSGNRDQTPRYDYNQIMYKLDLGDRRMALPGPVKLGGQTTDFDAARSARRRQRADRARRRPPAPRQGRRQRRCLSRLAGRHRERPRDHNAPLRVPRRRREAFRLFD